MAILVKSIKVLYPYLLVYLARATVYVLVLSLLKKLLTDALFDLLHQNKVRQTPRHTSTTVETTSHRNAGHIS